jgi:antitoxin (DNA-binding transcriptional repressor) of toxin-antitoxin stability system
LDIAISEHEAHRRFAELLLEVQDGTTFLITIDGQIVAHMRASSDDPREREEVRRMLEENPEL